MDNDNTGKESNDGDISNDNASSDSDSSSVKGDVTAGGEGHSSWVDGSTTYPDFTSPDDSTGADTPSQPRDFSSRYSLGADLGTGSQSESLSSRYSLGVDTSLSGDSKSQTDHTAIEGASYSTMPRSESWASRLSLGIETGSPTSSGYSLGLDRSLGIGSDSTSSRFSLGIFDEPTSSPFLLRTGEQLQGDTPRLNDPKEAPRTKPENQASTPKPPGKDNQQPSSGIKSQGSSNITERIKEYILNIKEQLRGYVNSAFRTLENEASEIIAKQEKNPGKQYIPSEKCILTNPLPNAAISDLFGTRDGMHKGIDLSAPKGTSVKAAGDGIVTVIEERCKEAQCGKEKVKRGELKGYGKYVVIDHRNGLETVYAHLDSVSVKSGKPIKQGQEIGKVGNTGRSRGRTGDHLHFEVRKNGQKNDPKNYVGFD